MSNIIVPKAGEEPIQMDFNAAIDRYWRHRETGLVVEVQKNLRIDGTIRRVVYLNPESKMTMSCFLKEFERDFEAMGNTSAKF